MKGRGEFNINVWFPFIYVLPLSGGYISVKKNERQVVLKYLQDE
jgi:hypothetical protein